MFVADCFDVNEKGHLTIGGCDTVGLAKEYGTPLYVMDEMAPSVRPAAFIKNPFRKTMTAMVWRFTPVKR